jgi:hypothetical protein
MFGDGFELFTGLARDGGIYDEIDEIQVSRACLSTGNDSRPRDPQPAFRASPLLS